MTKSTQAVAAKPRTSADIAAKRGAQVAEQAAARIQFDYRAMPGPPCWPTR